MKLLHKPALKLFNKDFRLPIDCWSMKLVHKPALKFKFGKQLQSVTRLSKGKYYLLKPKTRNYPPNSVTYVEALILLKVLDVRIEASNYFLKNSSNGLLG